MFMSHSLTIGLVYDLREEYLTLGYSDEETNEFDSAVNIEEMSAAIARLGHQVDRIGNGRALAQRLVAGGAWDLVFSMAEGLYGRSRETQVPALLELYDQPYVFSDPLTMAATLDKAVAKRLVRDAGVPTSPFILIESPDDTEVPWLSYPAFVKPVAEGTSKGIGPRSKVHNRAELALTAKDLLARFRQPVIVEAFLPGREFTVGVIGHGRDARVLGVVEITMNADADPEIFSTRNKADQERLCTFRKATDPEAQLAADRGLVAYRALGCRDAGRIDLRSDAAGSPHFLEANPLAGLHPTGSDLPVLALLHGVSYDDLMGRILEAAGRRYGGFSRLVEGKNAPRDGLVSRSFPPNI
jgi:D-alanine-D-alanine ligase